MRLQNEQNDSWVFYITHVAMWVLPKIIGKLFRPSPHMEETQPNSLHCAQYIIIDAMIVRIKHDVLVLSIISLTYISTGCSSEASSRIFGGHLKKFLIF